MSANEAKSPCSDKERVIEHAQGLCCPPRDESLWNAHPRVYLTPDEQGVAVCPYCSTRYRLAGH